MAITARTLQGRYLMRPSERVNEIILGILGRAQALYEIELHAFIFLSNHLHLMLQAISVFQMSDFVGYVKGNVARELGHEYNWLERFWGRRFHSQSNRRLGGLPGLVVPLHPRQWVQRGAGFLATRVARGQLRTNSLPRRIHPTGYLV